jgi:predicted 3-demethylubiquinone-9 3-methyltransferase (glyoxalase superfamily)
MSDKAAVCLWFDKDAEEAARFYTATFPDSALGAISRAPGDYPAGEEGAVLTVEFTLCGLPYVGLNGGPYATPSEAYSLQVFTETQEETDRLWGAIVGNGGSEMQCGWCKDKWGFAWQIVPRQLNAALAHPDRAAAKRAFEAMMQMVRIDIAAIEAALEG